MERSGGSSKGKKREREASGVVAAAANAPPTTDVQCSLGPSHLPALASAFKGALPFPHIHLLRPFSPALLASVRAELLAWEATGVGWVERRNDLYSFKQSSSLAAVAASSVVGGGGGSKGKATTTTTTTTTPSVSAFTAYLYSPSFRALVEGITGERDLAGTVDASAACYRAGDYLLCHDDDLATRRVAFILYLTPEGWEESDGGKLGLFQCEHQGGSGGSGSGSTKSSAPCGPRPTHITATIPPLFGSLLLFTVTPTSYHAVAEVLEDTKGPRLSISGWFHAATPAPPRLPTFHTPYPPVHFHPQCSLSLSSSSGGGSGGGGGGGGSGSGSASRPPLFALASPHPPSFHLSLHHWVNPTYLKPSTARSIAARLGGATGGGRCAAAATTGSGVTALLLPDFFTPQAYTSLCRALQSAPWRAAGGAPSLASYKVAHTSWEVLHQGQQQQQQEGELLPPSPLSLQMLHGVSGGGTPSPLCPIKTALALLCSREFTALLRTFLLTPPNPGPGAGGAGGAGAFPPPGSAPPLSGEVWGVVRAFAPGDYTIITDPQYLAKSKAKKAAGRVGGGGGAGGGGLTPQQLQLLPHSPPPPPSLAWRPP